MSAFPTSRIKLEPKILISYIILAGHLLTGSTWPGNRVLCQIVIFPTKPWMAMGVTLGTLGIIGCHKDVIWDDDWFNGQWLQQVLQNGLKCNLYHLEMSLGSRSPYLFGLHGLLWVGKSKCNTHVSSRMKQSQNDDLLVSKFDLLTNCQGLKDGASSLIHESFYKFLKIY